MKQLSLFILLLNLISCTLKQPEEQKQSLYIDPNTSKYVNEFVNSALKRGLLLDTSNLVVVVVDQIPFINNPNTIGFCSVSNKGPTVFIKSDFWFNRSEDDKELLIFHELGHCLLGKTHTDGISKAQDKNLTSENILAPSSLMNTYHIGGYWYGNNKEIYKDRLFKNDYNNILYWN